MMRGRIYGEGWAGAMARESWAGVLMVGVTAAVCVWRMVDRGMWQEALLLATAWPGVWFGLGVRRGWRERETSAANGRGEM